MPAGSSTRGVWLLKMSLARSKGLSPDKLSYDPASYELEKVGGAFNPMAESQRENGIQQRVLPENVYTAAIVAWLNNESASEAAIGAAFFTAPPVALTIFLQVTLTYYLQVGVKDYDGDLEAVCLTDHRMLLYTGLSAFVGLSLGNLYTILEAHNWLHMFGSCEQHEELMLQKYLLKPTQQAPTGTGKEESGKERSSVYPDCVDEAMDGVARSMEGGLGEAMGTDDVRGVCRPQSGITPCARASFYAFLLLPWAAVTVGVLFAGSGSVLRSGNRFDLVPTARRHRRQGRELRLLTQIM